MPKPGKKGGGGGIGFLEFRFPAGGGFSFGGGGNSPIVRGPRWGFFFNRWAALTQKGFKNFALKIFRDFFFFNFLFPLSFLFHKKRGVFLKLKKKTPL